jgi:thiol-disulfide isomerase/thioredoxin
MKKKVLFIAIAAVLLGALSFVTVKEIVEYFETKSGEEAEVVAKPKSKKTAYVNKNAKLSDITKEDGVVNVYIFWGNGCPHCKAEWEMIEEIRKDHAGEFAVYGFEVWYDHDNRELLDRFAAAVGKENVNAVPFLIIGDKYYEGKQDEDEFLSEIEYARKNPFDVYFEKIK